VTADQVGLIFSWAASDNLSACYATNSLFTASGTSNITLVNCYTNATNTGIYQTVGGGGYYLAAGSPYQNAGTATIPAALLADLQTLTTYPPVVVAQGFFTNNYTFFPHAQRDTDTLDLGFHYPPIDYAVAMAVSTATVIVLPGTVLAGYGPQYGVWLNDNAVFNCSGTVTYPNYIVRYNTVQEQSNTNWESTNWEATFVTPAQADTSSAYFFFTEWSVLTTDNQLEGLGYQCPVGWQSCQIYNGGIVGSGPPLSATNCLLRRVATTLTDLTNDLSETFYNNLFYAGELTVTHTNTGTFTFRDNLFNQTSNILTGSINYCSNNAYVTTNFGLLSPTNSDVFLASSPAFETGALGVYYYPTTLSSLIYAGSQLASAAGLYHYTVTTNNVIEGTHLVSIGFHYVAVGANGLPLDTNGDGIPDYLEDANGNGLVDSGEIDWQVPGDLGLTVIITQPSENSSIP